jgi:small-conductance mechanosensitive channel
MSIITFKYFTLGDLVEVNSIFGVIDEFNLFNTVLRISTGEKVVIPNSVITSSSFKNYYDREKVYAEIFITLSNNNKIDYPSFIEELKKELIEKCPFILKEANNVKIVFNDMSLPGTKLGVRIWIKSVDYLTAMGSAKPIIRNFLENKKLLLLDNYYLHNSKESAGFPNY